MDGGQKIKDHIRYLDIADYGYELYDFDLDRNPKLKASNIS